MKKWLSTISLQPHSMEHICKDCLDSSDDLILISNGTYYNLVELKNKDKITNI